MEYSITRVLHRVFEPCMHANSRLKISYYQQAERLLNFAVYTIYNLDNTVKVSCSHKDFINEIRF